MRTSLMAAAIAACLAGAAGANDYTTYVALPVTLPGAPNGASCDTIALLNLPAGWHPGDAVIVMLAAGPAHNPQRDPLVAAFLAERAGVLEVSPGVPAACTGADPEASRLARRADALDVVFGSLLAAKRQARAGAVVAIGHGPGGNLALAAMDEAVANARLGAGAPRFAAALAIGDERRRFRLGATRGEGEPRELRLGMLCEVLTRSGGTHGAENGQACAMDLEAGAVSVRTALRR